MLLLHLIHLILCNFPFSAPKITTADAPEVTATDGSGMTTTHAPGIPTTNGKFGINVT